MKKYLVLDYEIVEYVGILHSVIMISTTILCHNANILTQHHRCIWTTDTSVKHKGEAIVIYSGTTYEINKLEKNYSGLIHIYILL